MAGHDDWEEHWERYADAATRNPAQRMRHAIVLRLLGLGKGDGAGSRILDLGSGQGDLLALMAAAFPRAQLAGFELSRGGVELTRRKVPAARVEVVDLFRPPPEAESFRGWATHVVCSEVLEHVDDPLQFLRTAHGYLADGARLVVTVPGGPMSAFDRHIGHRRHFTRPALAGLLGEAGFAVERGFRAGFPFFNLYRLLVIARGEGLVADAAGERPGSSRIVRVAMAVFRVLFVFNLRDAPGGWQTIAVARRAAASSTEPRSRR